MAKKPVKEKVKAKAKAVKAKVKAKVKASAAVIAAILGMAVFSGCMDTAPASRATTATYSFTFEFGDGAKSVTVNNTLGDGALASADSSGSIETQTATPTMDIKPDIDVRYNDAIAGATAASKTTLGQIGDGVTAVLDMMQTKQSGTVKVTKTDGSEATVKCEDGQCSFCEDGVCTPTTN